MIDTAGAVAELAGADPAPPPSGWGARRRFLIWIAVACLAATAVLYVLALGVDRLQDFDRDLRYPQIVGDWRHRDAASDDFGRVVAGGFVAWGAAIAALALAVGRLRRLALAGGVVAAAALAAWLASEGLGALDLVGGEGLRYAIDGNGVHSPSPGAFPSGHAAVATALAVATVVALPPRLRAVGVAVTAPAVAAVCVGLMALGWHYPSDILGGVLLSTAVGAGVVAMLGPAGDRGVRSGVPRLIAAAAAALALCAGAGLWGLRNLPDETAGVFVDAHPRFIAFCAIAAVAALMCLAAVALAMSAQSAREADAGDPTGLTGGERIG